MKWVDGGRKRAVEAHHGRLSSVLVNLVSLPLRGTLSQLSGALVLRHWRHSSASLDLWRHCRFNSQDFLWLSFPCKGSQYSGVLCAQLITWTPQQPYWVSFKAPETTLSCAGIHWSHRYFEYSCTEWEIMYWALTFSPVPSQIHSVHGYILAESESFFYFHTGLLPLLGTSSYPGKFLGDCCIPFHYHLFEALWYMVKIIQILPIPICKARRSVTLQPFPQTVGLVLWIMELWWTRCKERQKDVCWSFPSLADFGDPGLPGCTVRDAWPRHPAFLLLVAIQVNEFLVNDSDTKGVITDYPSPDT